MNAPLKAYPASAKTPNLFTRILFGLRNRHFLLLDVLLLAGVPTLALLFRVDWSEAFSTFALPLVAFTALALAVKLPIFLRAGLYARYWRYASIDELGQIALAVALASLLLNLFFYFILIPVARFSPSFPRSISLTDFLLTLVVVGGSRFAVRLAERQRQQVLGVGDGKRVLVIGAGDAGRMIVREMQANPRVGLQPIGFIDDDPNKQGVRIHNVPVLGKHERLAEIARDHKISQAIIAMPTAPGKTIRELVRVCECANLAVRIVPGIYEILDGHVTVNQIRNVEIEDLLRREPIHTDIASVSNLLRAKRVLITGGGGSIGSELCRQVLRCEPAELIIVGHGENSVFEIGNDLRQVARRDGLAQTRLQLVIADVRFPERLRAIFAEYHPQIVFHAAAHKHVPLMELNPSEAITNNVLGTRNLLDVSLAFGVERFVMISTDKAVNPTGIMGASKRVAELLVHRAAISSGHPYVTVRFGNVLGSRGSVVLTFKKQIAAGGPLTVTHPDMQRFFMTIPEAVQLVLQASVLGQGDEVFVLDMGQPVKILDLARDLIELSGLQVGRDIDIEFVGLRPGEKLFEELIVDGEDYRRTRHEKIFIANNTSRLLPTDLDASVEALLSAAAQNDRAQIVSELQNLVGEYTPVQANAMPNDQSSENLEPLQTETFPYRTQQPTYAR